MRRLRTFIFVAISSASVWPQSADSALSQFVGQQYILPRIGDAERIKVRQSDLDHLKGTCDAAVLVRAAHWKSGTARFELEHTGMPMVAGQPRGECRMSYDRMVLEITSFARDE